MKNKVLCVVSILFLSVNAFAGKIKGSVICSGKGVEFANVFLKGTAIGAITNINGYYEIDHIEPGTYTIIASNIGYIQDSSSCTIKENETLTIHFKLKESEINLNEVTVTATMKEVSISESPVAIDIITPKLFQKKPQFQYFRISKYGEWCATANAMQCV